MRLDKVLEAGRVMRYHAAPVDKKQSVAEHSWGVAIIILKIHPEASGELLQAALLHDVGEVITGDVPSPVKRVNSEVKRMFDEMEIDAMNEMEVDYPCLTKEEEKILKIADCLEGVKYCNSRIQAGDNGAIGVRDRYIVYLNNLGWSTKEIDNVCK